MSRRSSRLRSISSLKSTMAPRAAMKQSKLGKNGWLVASGCCPPNGSASNFAIASMSDCTMSSQSSSSAKAVAISVKFVPSWWSSMHMQRTWPMYPTCMYPLVTPTLPNEAWLSTLQRYSATTRCINGPLLRRASTSSSPCSISPNTSEKMARTALCNTLLVGRDNNISKQSGKTCAFSMDSNTSALPVFTRIANRHNTSSASLPN
mmetsp:Transcript_107297/g.212998  ORF Transcript_107297/g.212998 Transcript_107297/m.212998 type:complete len:206 (-) Transcript_107297:906-1523(-)